MNLTPSHLQEKWASEVTKETANVGDFISYVDTSNYIKYQIVEKTDDYIKIQDTKVSEFEDYRTFDQLNNRWEFCLKNN